MLNFNRKLLDDKQNINNILDSELIRQDKIFSDYENKKIIITFNSGGEFLEISDNKNGKIKINPNWDKQSLIDKYVFFEGKKTSRYYKITLGLSTGCNGVLTLTDIKLVS